MKSLLHRDLSFIALSILTCCIFGFAEEVNGTALQRFANAHNEFSMELHRRLSGSRNLFFSPTSLFFALMMLYKGAGGQTQKELRDVLGLQKVGLSDDEIDYSLQALLNETFDSSKNYTLKTANAILVDHDLKLVTKYQKDMKDYFGAKVMAVDFRRDTNEVVQRINHWIRDQTNGKIDNFLDDLESSTLLAVLNAVYFKGLWSIPFEKETTWSEKFHNDGNKKSIKLVPTMHMSHKILYTSSPDWQMVELPYLGGKISMVIILPGKLNGLADTERSLTPEKITLYRNKMRMLTVNLSLPRFKIENSIEMSEPLESLGLGNMFRNGANFSRMVEGPGVRVSSVMHKAFVDVNEEGTEAAAASGVYIVPLSLSVPREFKADHPFFFAIVEKSTNLILFSGHVNRL